MKTWVTGEIYVAVERDKVAEPRVTPEQTKIIQGIGSAQSMAIEDILRAMGLSDPKFAQLEQNIADATRKIILEAAGSSMTDHAKDVPGVLIYEWDMTLGYAVQMRFLRDLLYIHNTQRSEIRIVLPANNVEAERFEDWIGRDLFAEDWTGFVIMRASVGQAVREILEKNQGLDLIQMTGLPKILARFSDKRTKGIQGFSYGLASLIPGQILILSETPLAQMDRSLQVVAMLDVYNILRGWASERAAEIAA